MLETYPRQVMKARGLTPAKIVQAMHHGRRFTPKQIKTRALVVSRVLRNGNCGEYYAKQLAHVLGIDPTYLELPRQCWPKAWRGESQGALKATEKLSSASGGRGGNPSRRTKPNPDPKRMEILRLVP